MSELFFDGAKLKEQREKKGWSYERMADEISTPEHPMTSERVAELERMRSEITLEDVARQVGLCKSECCRVFKGYMKESLFEYLLKYRIEKSIPDVLEGKLTMTETAIRAGFTDPNYFSKVFHKIKGCSPRSYRKTRSSPLP